MRVSILLTVSLLIYNTCFANEKIFQNDTVLMRMADSIFIDMIQNKLSSAKHCSIKYGKSNPHIDIFDYRYKSFSFVSDISFVNRSFQNSKKFCADSIDYVKALQNNFDLLESKKYQIEFYYKEKGNKTIEVLCIFTV